MVAKLTQKLTLVLLLLACCNFNLAASQSITVAVATNFKPLLTQLTPSFTQQTNIKVRISTASTGVLYNQIRHGAPFDVFLSADSERPKLLEQQNLVANNSRATYALGQLALVSNDKSLTASLSLLKNWQGKLAIANPRIAPYGLAAKQTLSHLNLWPWQHGHLIQGNSVAQTYQFVHSGNIKLALVAHAQLIASNKTFVGGYYVVPRDMHQSIAQQLVVLKGSKQLDAAKRFASWILAPNQQQQIVKAGYAAFGDYAIEGAGG